MLKDLILFRRYGRQIVGDIVEDKFVFHDDEVGSVTHRQAEISYITLSAYGNKDEMKLVNPTTYVGKVLTDSIAIIVAGSSRRVTAEMRMNCGVSCSQAGARQRSLGNAAGAAGKRSDGRPTHNQGG